MMLSSDYFSSRVGDPDFPVISAEIISQDQLCVAVQSVLQQLEARNRIFDEGIYLSHSHLLCQTYDS